jgi:MoaA/NifB/PqqE/SkfB family radical SAM enzyme
MKPDGTPPAAKRTIRPRVVQIEASSFCQLRCPSCPTASRAIHPAVGSGYLRFDNFRKLLDDNPSIAAVELSNYGEIFLNPQLVKILALAFERNVAVSAANGVNLNHVRDDVLEALVKYKLRAMTCSIDGASQETYKVYRVRGDFDTVVGNIKKINAYKRQSGSEFPRLRWQFIVFGHNEHEVPLARSMAAELGMEFFAKLSWDDSLSPLKHKEAVRREAGLDAATREEFRERNGRDYAQGICNQLWDSPQINWDGKVLGCCRNFWGDFGGNAFSDGLVASLNNEKINYARDMLRGRLPARTDIPCTTCDIYIGMQKAERWLERDDVARGQSFTVDEALVIAAEWQEQGRIADAARAYRQILQAQPGHPEAFRRLISLTSVKLA